MKHTCLELTHNHGSVRHSHCDLRERLVADDIVQHS
jgi:hypothetical protein